VLLITYFGPFLTNLETFKTKDNLIYGLFLFFLDQKHDFSKWPLLGLFKKRFLKYFYEEIILKDFLNNIFCNDLIWAFD
jgi:hypothetical protein